MSWLAAGDGGQDSWTSERGKFATQREAACPSLATINLRFAYAGVRT